MYVKSCVTRFIMSTGKYTFLLDILKYNINVSVHHYLSAKEFLTQNSQNHCYDAYVYSILGIKSVRSILMNCLTF